jgi:hypothetical protein
LQPYFMKRISDILTVLDQWIAALTILRMQ